MAIIIEARVQEKMATYAEWMANDLVLLRGEWANVVDANGAVTNYRIGNGVSPFRDLPNAISYDQGAFVPLLPNGDLPTPTVDVAYTLQFGDELMNVMYWDGSTWSVSDTIALPKGEKGDTGERGEKGDDGVSVESASIDSNGDLIIELSDTTEINAGNAKGETGATGKGLKPDGFGDTLPAIVPAPADGSNSYIFVDETTEKWYVGEVGTSVWTEIPIEASSDDDIRAVLKSFLEEEIITTYTELDMSLGIWNYNTLAFDFIPGDTANKSIKIDTSNVYSMDVDLVVGSLGDPINKAKWKAVFAIKNDNSKVIIKEYNDSGATRMFETLDTSDYKEVYIAVNILNPLIANNTIKTYESSGDVPQGEDAVKLYIDDKISDSLDIINNSLYSFVNPSYTGAEVYKFNLILDSIDDSINGVEPQNDKLLAVDNTLVSSSEAGYIFKVWQNIPLIHDGVKITKLDFIDFLRIGGSGVFANLLAVDENGIVTTLIVGQSAQSIQTVTNIDVSLFESISICIAVNDVSNIGEDFDVLFYGRDEVLPFRDNVLASILENRGGGGGSSFDYIYDLESNYNEIIDDGDYGKTLNRIIESMPSKGGRIQIGVGNFLINTQVNITKNVSIHGMGASDHYGNNSLSRLYTNSPTLIAFNVSQVVKFDAVDFMLENTATTVTAGAGIKISGIDAVQNLSTIVMKSELDRMMVKGFYDNLFFDGACQWGITNSTITGHERYGLYIDCKQWRDAGDSRITACDFGNKSVGRYGISHIYQVGGGGLKVVNTKFNDVADYAYSSNILGDTVILIFTGCSFENYRLGAIKARKSTGVFRHINVIGCEFDSYRLGTTDISVYDGIQDINIIGNGFSSGMTNGDNVAINLHTVSGARLMNTYRGYANPINIYDSSDVKQAVLETPPATNNNI